MKRVLIHVGTSKTGSTSIQDALSSRISDSSVAYPVFHRKDHNILLPVLYPRQKWTDNFRREFGHRSDRYMKCWTEGYRNRLRRKLRNSDNVILSSEMIFTLETDAILSIKSDLVNAGYNQFLVLAYIRKPSDHYLSLMQELLKHHSNYLPPDRYNYRIQECLERWSEVFTGSVRCRRYGRSDSDDFDVVSDFFDEAEGFFATQLERPIRRFGANPTLPVEGLDLCHRFREMLCLSDTAGIDRSYERYLAVCRRILGRKKFNVTTPELTADIADFVDARHAADLKYLYQANFLDVRDWLTMTGTPGKPDFSSENFLSVLQGFNPEAKEALSYYMVQEFLRRDRRLLHFFVGYLRRKKRAVRRFIYDFRMLVAGLSPFGCCSLSRK